MRTTAWWRPAMALATAGAILAAAGGSAAGGEPHGPKAARQAADPLAFNLNDEVLGPVLVGGGILDRTRQSVHAAVSVTGLLEASAPYTAWWVVFNNPEFCTGGNACGPDDLGNEAANVAVFHATGFFSDAAGAANFTAHLKHGPVPAGTDVVLNDGDGVGLEYNNGLGAEIHIVVRGHGPAPDPNNGDAEFTVADQLSLFNGGCVGAVGDPADDACEDEQVFIFPAP